MRLCCRNEHGSRRPRVALRSRPEAGRFVLEIGDRNVGVEIHVYRFISIRSFQNYVASHDIKGRVIGNERAHARGHALAGSRASWWLGATPAGAAFAAVLHDCPMRLGIPECSGTVNGENASLRRDAGGVKRRWISTPGRDAADSNHQRTTPCGASRSRTVLGAVSKRIEPKRCHCARPASPRGVPTRASDRVFRAVASKKSSNPGHLRVPRAP